MTDTLKNAYSNIETASRYDSARNLPAETMTLWLAALQSSLPESKVKKILDLGCGTGRFTVPLGQAFACSVIGVEPASAMLDIARAQHNLNVEWKQGAAESIPWRMNPLIWFSCLRCFITWLNHSKRCVKSIGC